MTETKRDENAWLDRNLAQKGWWNYHSLGHQYEREIHPTQIFENCPAPTCRWAREEMTSMSDLSAQSHAQVGGSDVEEDAGQPDIYPCTCGDRWGDACAFPQLGTDSVWHRALGLSCFPASQTPDGWKGPRIVADVEPTSSSECGATWPSASHGIHRCTLIGDHTFHTCVTCSSTQSRIVVEKSALLWPNDMCGCACHDPGGKTMHSGQCCLYSGMERKPSVDAGTDCKHEDSMYGRCVACGMTWEKQAEALEEARRLAFDDVSARPFWQEHDSNPIDAEARMKRAETREAPIHDAINEASPDGPCQQHEFVCVKCNERLAHGPSVYPTPDRDRLYLVAGVVHEAIQNAENLDVLDRWDVAEWFAFLKNNLPAPSDTASSVCTCRPIAFGGSDKDALCPIHGVPSASSDEEATFLRQLLKRRPSKFAPVEYIESWERQVKAFLSPGDNPSSERES